MHFPPPSPNTHRPPSPIPDYRTSRAPTAMRHQPPPPRPQRWGLRIGLLLGLVGVVGGATLVAKLRFLPSGYVLPGLMIDGVRAPDKATAASVRSLVEERAKALGARTIALSTSERDKPVLQATL